LAALAQRKAEYIASEVEHAKKEVEEANHRLDEEKQAHARATQARDAAEKLSAQKSDDEEARKKCAVAAKVVAAAEASVEKATAAVASAKQAQSVAESLQVKAKAESDAAQETAKQAQKPVTSVTFSPDGSMLFTATADGAVHVWGADAGGAIETLKGHHASVTSLAAGPKGLLVSGSADGTAIVWQLSDQWKLVRTIGTGNGDSPLVGRVLAVAFSPDGSILATGGGVPSRSGELKLWSPADGTLLRDLPDAHSDTVFGLSFSGDGKSLASCAADKLVKAFSVADGKLLRTFEGHTNHVLGVGFRYDGRAILSGGLDNRLKWWDVQTGEQKGDPNQPPLPAEITSVNYVGFADLALITTGDGRARLLHSDGSIVRDFDALGAYLFAGAATPDGAYVLAGGQDGILRLWDGRDGKLLSTFPP
jgi:WD40 repeat protein